MTDITLIVAECRAEELLTALQRAVNGEPHWRLHATTLLCSIADHKLPEPQIEALREIDARKRAAEMMMDLSDE
jgi:hypothetical protein